MNEEKKKELRLILSQKQDGECFGPSAVGKTGGTTSTIVIANIY